MTLSYTQHMKLAVPDFLQEPWHDELRAAFDAIDLIIYEALIAENIFPWTNNTNYVVGNVIISPIDGFLFTCSVSHQSSPPPTTFDEERALHPTYWSSFAPVVATEAEAVAGEDNTHYMTPLRVKEAIAQFAPPPAEALRAQPSSGRLVYVGPNTIRLIPYKGNALFINGSFFTIPNSGVDLAPPQNTVTIAVGAPGVYTWPNHGLTNGSPIFLTSTGTLPPPQTIAAYKIGYTYANVLNSDTFTISTIPGSPPGTITGAGTGTHKVGTLWYIYAFMSSGVMTLEASRTPHVTSAATGTEIKQGDDTRAFVGMACNGSDGVSPNLMWIDSVSRRYVISWLNPKVITGYGWPNIQHATTSGTWIEVHQLFRVSFLAFANAHAGLGLSVNLFTWDVASLVIWAGLALDSYSAPAGPNARAFGYFVTQGGEQGTTNVNLETQLSEGFHFITLLGQSSGGTAGYNMQQGTYLRIYEG